MTARRLRLFGVVLGFALAAALLFASSGWIERVIAMTGADSITPYARPPFGMAARGALAAAGLTLGVALGFILALIFGRGELEGVDEYDSPAPAVPSPDSLNALGWRAPAGTVATSPVIARTTAGEADIAALFAANPGQPSVSPIAQSQTPPAIDRAPEQDTVSSENRDHPPMPDQTSRLARIEATLADLTRSSTSETWERLETIDARLIQMAQQLAEIAALGRAQQRTPERVRAPQPPADPAQRLAMTETARLLRARLGDAELV